MGEKKRTNVLVQRKMERKNCRNIDKRGADIFHEYNNSLHYHTACTKW